eukprot:jgi/Hompol1/824/HPOL_003435-RA
MNRRNLAQGIPLASTSAAAPAAAIASSSSSSSTSTSAAAAKNYSEARIQIRANGQSFTQSFQAEDTLERVYEFLAEKTGSQTLKLSQTFPRKVLDGSDRAKTLKELNLVPSAALVAN